MNTNHDDHANHVKRDKNGTESRRNRLDTAPNSTGDRSRSQTASLPGDQHPAESSDGCGAADMCGGMPDIACRLDWLRPVASEDLGSAVVGRGACMEPLSDGVAPGWLFDKETDPDTAASLCAGCSVRDECLELELRLLGADVVGMWGALGENGRRAVHPAWAARRADTDGRGGELR